MIDCLKLSLFLFCVDFVFIGVCIFLITWWFGRHHKAAATSQQECGTPRVLFPFPCARKWPGLINSGKRGPDAAGSSAVDRFYAYDKMRNSHEALAQKAEGLYLSLSPRRWRRFVASVFVRKIRKFHAHNSKNQKE